MINTARVPSFSLKTSQRAIASPLLNRWIGIPSFNPGNEQLFFFHIMGTTQRTNMYNPLSCKTQTANTLYKALAPKDYVRYYALLAPKII